MKNNKKVFVLASVLLFSGFLLGGNSQVVKAAGTTNSDTAKQTTDSESTVEGENVTTADDGTVSADITYNGVKYSVKGKIGTTVKATPVDGSSTDAINISIMDRELSDPSNKNIMLDGPSGYRYQIFNDFGQPIDGEYRSGLQNFPAYQEMKNQDGEIYYRIDNGKWIQQYSGVNLDGDFESSSYKESPYFVINRVVSKEVNEESPKTKSNIVYKDGVASGTFTKYSDKYNRDFEYTFSGKIGETVVAKLENPEDKAYKINPIKVTIFNSNTAPEDLASGSGADLAGSESKQYKLYSIIGQDISQVSRSLAGGGNWVVDKIEADEYGNIYYRSSTNEWVKKVDGVSLNSDEDVTMEPDIALISDKVTADVTIPSNLGNQKVSAVSGEIGDDINVTVPPVGGYKADKSTVSAHVNEDGTITTKDSVKYTPIKSNSSSSSNTDTVEPEYLKQTVSTFPDKPNVKLYHLNADSMTADDTRALAPNSDWQSDQRVVVKGDTYYRVATNEWVKASQVYIYTAHPIVVETKPNGIKKLASAEGNTVTDRALASDTDWYSDRIAYLNDGTTEYYRVATNEFVKQNDVNEITK